MDWFTVAENMKLLKHEIGQWADTRQTIHLRFCGTDWAGISTWQLPDFSLTLQSYYPKSEPIDVMWYSFSEKAWFRPPQETRLALRKNDDIDLDAYLQWNGRCIDTLLFKEPFWYQYFIFHRTMLLWIEKKRIKVSIS